MRPDWHSCSRTTATMVCRCASTSIQSSVEGGEEKSCIPMIPSLKSFVEVAADSHFPIQNLPFGVFSTDADPAPRVGVAIGDQIVDLAVLEEAGLLTAGPTGSRVFIQPSLNTFIALGEDVWRETRASISELLRHGN